MVEYKHGLAQSLVRALGKLANRGKGPHRICEFLNMGEYTNFAKLRYWGLIVKADGGERGGVWEITDRGLRFLLGEIGLPQFAWVYRGDVVRWDGNLVTVDSV
jgi:hypothetical protein